MGVMVYTGKGTSFAKDVMTSLRKLKIPFHKIKEKDILQDKLNKYSILIIPGGWPNKYAHNLGSKGYDKIRKFVKNGGRYIGICAGADIASKKFEVKEGKFSGLGLINSIAKMEVRKILSGRLREINTSKSFLTRNCPKKIKIWYENGPVFEPNKSMRIIATYENSNAAIVYSRYGKGSVILFSPHPEGNLEDKIDPIKYGTIILLKNALV
jgi:glutamine amidotransferase-like uncharacterized protein